MHCANCALTIEDAFEKVPGVIKVRASYQKNEVVVTSKKPLAMDMLNNVLHEKGTHYTLVTSPVVQVAHGHDYSVYTPVLLIYGVVILFMIIRAAVNSMWMSEELMADFMGAFFIIFSAFKIANIKNFPAAFKKYDLLAQWIPGYGTIYPFIELFLGIGFLLRYSMDLLSVVTIVVMGIGSIGVIKALMGKRQIECACLGGFFKLPMSKVALFEDLSMVGMATLMLLS